MAKIIFFLIFAFTALFRITNLDIIEFKIDEASNLFLASLPLFGDPFPPGGIVSSIGILNSPLFNYILFPILLISLEPQVVVFFIALANSLANGFFYLIIRKYYNNTLAIITTLLIAFSPWSILFSRKIWPPDLIFPLLVILFLSIHKILIDKKTVFWIPILFVSLFLIQLEMASGFFVLLGGILFLLQKPKINIKYILVGIFIGTLPMIPYFIYQLQDNCQGCNFLLQALGKKLSEKHLDIFIRPFQILNQGNFRFVLGNHMTIFADNFPFAYNLKAFFYSEYVLMPIGAFLFWKNYKKFRFFVYIIILLPILYFLFGIESQMHYFIIIVPLLFLFLGTIFYFLITSKNSLLRRISIFYFSSLILYSVVFNASFFKFIREFGNGMDGDYGSPLNLNQQDIKDKFVKYQNNPEYQQIINSSYIPLYIMHGTSPFAKMIYPYRQTQKILPILEQRLKNQPQDPRVLHQLISYYSAIDPKAQTIDYLRKKTKKFPEYTPIYDEIYALYLQNKLKKVHVSQEFKFLFEFPKHWDFEEVDDKIVIKSSDYYVQIEADPRNFDKLMSWEKYKSATYTTKKTTVLNMLTEKTECITSDKKWCGIIYNLINFNKKTFLISYNYIERNSVELKDSKDRDLLFTVKVMDEIVSSIKKL